MSDGRPRAAGDERSAITYKYEGPDLRAQAKALRQKKSDFAGMGGEDRIRRQHDAGKLTVRRGSICCSTTGHFSSTACWPITSLSFRRCKVSSPLPTGW
jgi:hypothetical protein